MHCIQNTVEITILLYINFIPLCCKVSYVLFYCNTFHLRRRRHVATSSPICVWTFQSTPPAKAETDFDNPVMISICHFNPLHPRRRRRIREGELLALTIISIHSTREGGDFATGHFPHCIRISIHSTREGGDSDERWDICIYKHFNPLHPRRRRHILCLYKFAWITFQSTPPAKAETDSQYQYASNVILFQSTPPAKAET